MDVEYGKDFDESEYASALAELVINSKPIINNLTIIAGENKGAGEQIVRLIESRIQTVRSSFFSLAHFVLMVFFFFVLLQPIRWELDKFYQRCISLTPL